MHDSVHTTVLDSETPCFQARCEIGSLRLTSELCPQGLEKVLVDEVASR